MRYYITLHNEKYDLESFTPIQKRFIKEMIKYYKRNPHWNEFSNHWIKE